MVTGVKVQGFEDLKPEVEDLHYPRQLFITCFVFHRGKNTSAAYKVMDILDGVALLRLTPPYLNYQGKVINFS